MNFVRTSTDMIDMSQVRQVSRETAPASSGDVKIGDTVLKIVPSSGMGMITLNGAKADAMWEAMGAWAKPWSTALASTVGELLMENPFTSPKVEAVKAAGVREVAPAMTGRAKHAVASNSSALSAAANAVKLEGSNV